MLKSTIVDTRVRLRPSKKLLASINAQKEHLRELPANVATALEKNGYSVPKSIRILKDSELVFKRPQIDTKLLEKLTADVPDVPQKAAEAPEEEEEQQGPVDGHFLYLNDLHWLNSALTELRKKNVINVFLYELIESCELILPENEFKPRNPELEARCQRLREEQQNREYQKMTKNVDATLKHVPEDTVAYQLKSINKQIIAVAQFIFSVAAGFTFGFFGVNLMVGPLPFGFRILLGVIVALVIALAEMYFLAKKLHEYDEVLDAPKRKTPNSPKVSGVQNIKPHVD
ncbi:transmembrane protein 199 [Drosophila novamexicana]|uniref:transmembrane protein 199 n=1 Tax=Drosophila novamexicana TaxID=47314 RepID=UPI0011E5C63D|nr:transmembrane protein 199 [Drosophila novamexicana]